MFFPSIIIIFICFLKDKTLHNHLDYAGFSVPYYNIPSNNRELQQMAIFQTSLLDYNIPSNNRELQLSDCSKIWSSHYNIPSNNRELQPHEQSTIRLNDYNIPSNNRELQRFGFAPLSALDYNIPSNNRELQQKHGIIVIGEIITYQVITGNYSEYAGGCSC